MLYLTVIMVTAAHFGRGPSTLASVLSVAAFDFCFVPPFYTFAVADARYVLPFARMLAVGIVISRLTERVRMQAEAARGREQRTAILYSLSREPRAGQEVHLTPHEYKLIEVLIRPADRVVTHRQLLREVWEPGHGNETRYLRVYMASLRQKLESVPGRPRWFITETGVGYRLRLDGDLTPS